MMRRSWGLVLVLVSTCCCRGAEVKGTDGAVVLIDNLSSYESPSQVREKLGGVDWKVVSDTALSKGDPRPAFSEYTVIIENYHDLGIAGDLQLRFLNQRLMEADFFPEDFLLYLRRASEAVGRDLGDNTEISPVKNKVIWSRRTPGRPFVGFADKRLQDEAQEWIRKYATLPGVVCAA